MMKSVLSRRRATFLLLPAVLVPFAAAQSTVTAAGSGNWGVGTTWVGDVAPGGADTASFSGLVLTLDNNYTVGALVFGAGGALLGNSTSLTVGGAITIDAGGANANELLYSPSSLATVTINSLGPTDLFAPANTTDGLSDDNFGNAVWNNQSGATFTLHDSASLLTGVTGSLFTNAAGAVFTHTGGGGGIVNWLFVNHGTFDVAQGSLVFQGTTVTSDGTMSVSPGAALIFNSSTLGGGATITGTGTVSFNTLTLAGTATVSTLVWLPGTGITGASPSLTLSGAVEVDPGGSNANELLYTGTGTGSVTINSLGATDAFASTNTTEGLFDNNSGTAVWNNLAGGVFTLHDSASLITGVAGSRFTNAAGATFVHTGAGAGTVEWAFANHGTLDVAQGSLAFQSTTLTSDGTISVASGAALQVSNSAFNSTGTVTLDSGATLGLSASTLGSGTNITGTGVTTFAGTNTLGGSTLFSTGLAWAPGAAVTGTNAVLTLSGAVTLDADFANVNELLFAGTSSATITVNSLGPADVYAAANTTEGLFDNNSGNAFWNNLAGGVFTLHDSASLTTGVAGSLFTNAAGATFVHTGTGAGTVEWAFANHGTLDVAQGSLAFQSTTLTSDGTISVASGAALQVSNSAFNSIGTVTLDSGATLGLSASTLGPGTNITGAGVTTLSGANALAGSASVSNLVWLPSASLAGAGAALTLSGTVVLNPGSANANEYLFSSTNSATITVNSLGPADVYATANTTEGLFDNNSGNAFWNNLAGGVFTLHDSASLVTGVAGSLFTNAAGATFVHTGLQDGVVQWGFVNHGLVNVAAGTLEFNATTFGGDGTVSVSSGALLYFNSSNLGSGTTIGGPGPVTFNTLTLAGTATLSTLTWAPGAGLTGANATVTLAGPTTLNGGGANADEYLYPATNTASITVNSPGATDVYATANTTEGLFDNNSGAAFWNNLAGGVFTLHDSASLVTSAGGSMFTNASGASFVHSGGQTGVVQWAFVNHGLVNVAAGTLEFQGTTLTSDGTVSVSSDASLYFNNSTLGAGTTIAGPGPVILSTLTVASTATIANLAWLQGATITGANATLTLSGPAGLDVAGANADENLYASTSSALITVNSLGATDVYATANTTQGLSDAGTGSARWNNLTGGVFTLHDSASLVTGGVGSVFTNALGGTFVHTGSQDGVVQWDFVNHGLINVAAGTLEFQGTTLASDGTVSVASGATLYFNNSTLGDESTVVGTGPVTFSTLSLAGAATLATVAWAPNATLTGANATLTLSGAATLNGGAANADEYLYASTSSALITVNSLGATDVYATANTTQGLSDASAGTARWNNLSGGVFTLHDSASLVTGGVGSVFTNALGGTFVHTGGQTGVVQWGLVNHGLIDVAAGTLDFAGTTLTSDGTVSVASGATLLFDSSTLGDGATIGGVGPTTFTTLNLAGTATISTLGWTANTTLTGKNATLTLSGTATINGSGANANEFLYASTSSALITVNNVGTTDVFATANTTQGLSDNGTGTARWNNLSGAVFTLHDSASLVLDAGSIFTNALGGTFVHTGGQTGVVQWNFVNHGLIDVAAGTLDFAGTTLTSDGTVNVASGTALLFDGSTLGDGTTIGGVGPVTFTTLNVAGTATISTLGWGPNTVLTGANSTLTLSGAATLNGGAANANEFLYASTSLALVTVNNVGTTDVFATANTTQGLSDAGTGSARWNNLSGGVFTLHDSASLVTAAGSVFTNAVGGSFVHTGGQTGEVQWDFVNHGFINVAQGTLDFTGTTLTSDGTVSVSSGAALLFTSSTLGSGAVIGGAGPVTFDTLTLAGAATIATLAWAPNAVLTGANATLTLSGTATLNGGAANADEYLYASTSSALITVNNVGTTDVFATANTTQGLSDASTGTARWNNLSGGVFTLHDSASLVTGAAGSVFTNAAGASFVHAGSQTGVVQWAFNNAGSVEVQAGGTLAFQDPVAQDDGAGDLTGGTWIVDSNATLVFPGNPSFTTIAAGATVTLNGVGSTFAAVNFVALNAGTFQLFGGRFFTFAGDLINNGVINVDGAGSALNVGNTSVSGGAGSLNLTNGGALAGTGTVSGTVTVGAGAVVNPGTLGGGAAGRLSLGSLTLLPGSILALNLTPDGSGTAGVDYSTLSVGSLNLSALSAGNRATILLNPATGQLLDVPDAQYTWILITSSGVVGSFVAGDFTINPGAFGPGASGTFALSVSGDSLDLSYVTIPEPSTVALLTGLGVLGLAVQRHRRVARRSIN